MLEYFFSLSDITSSEDYHSGNFDNVVNKVIHTLVGNIKCSKAFYIKVGLNEIYPKICLDKKLHNSFIGLNAIDKSKYQPIVDSVLQMRSLIINTFNESDLFTEFNRDFSLSNYDNSNAVICAIKFSNDVVGLIGVVFENATSPGVELVSYLSSLSDILSTVWLTRKNQKHQKSLEQLKKALDLGALVSICDKSLRLVYLNENARNYIGIKEEEINDINAASLLHDDEKEKGLLDILVTLKQGKVWSGNLDFRHRITGEKVYTLTTYVPISSDDGGFDQVFGFHQDITEYKNIQEQFFYSSKLGAIGEMSAQLLHEVSNPLGIMSLSIDSLMRSVDREDYVKDDLQRNLKQIEQSSDRILNIFHSMKNILRGDTAKKENLKFVDIVSDVLLLVQGQLKNKSIELTLDIPEDFLVFCHGGYLGQVILNLINNSSDIIVNHDKPWIRIETIPDDNKSIITLTDSGRGMDTKMANSIFSNFYSSGEKSKSSGLGLGLGICKKLIEQIHAGKIYVDTNSSNTKFVIEIPKN